MKNGKRKEIRSFYRTDNFGEMYLCYDLGYGYISASDYHFYVDKMKYDDEKLRDVVRRYDDAIGEQEEEWDQEKEKIKIETYEDLMRYVYKNLLTKEQKEKVKSAFNKGERGYKLLKYFPATYVGVIKMKIEHDKKHEKYKQRGTSNVTDLNNITKPILENKIV